MAYPSAIFNSLMAGRILTIEFTDRCSVGEAVAVVSCAKSHKIYNPGASRSKKSGE
jgi:hypothetical protein